ncbi:MAG: hypothetical protein AB1489_33405 [Acidobacteriota bacterium]
MRSNAFYSDKMKKALFLLMLVLSSQVAYAQERLSVKVDQQQAAAVSYPILGANPFPLLAGDDLVLVEQALTLAHTLTQSCDCDKALQAYGVESLAATLIKIEINVNLFDGRESTLGLPFLNKHGERETLAVSFRQHKDWLSAGVISGRFTGIGNVIFLNSYFFTPTKLPLLAEQQRAITLIHESVHQFAGKSDEDFGGSDRLTALIIKGCAPNLGVKTK